MSTVFLVLFSFLNPALAVVFIWLLTDWVNKAFATTFWPLMGIFFLPTTTLVYMASMLEYGHLTGGYLILFVMAVFWDIFRKIVRTKDAIERFDYEYSKKR